MPHIHPTTFDVHNTISCRVCDFLLQFHFANFILRLWMCQIQSCNNSSYSNWNMNYEIWIDCPTVIMFSAIFFSLHNMFFIYSLIYSHTSNTQILGNKVYTIVIVICRIQLSLNHKQFEMITNEWRYTHTMCPYSGQHVKTLMQFEWKSMYYVKCVFSLIILCQNIFIFIANHSDWVK